MDTFLSLWHDAALTSLGFFWMALWAFILGYIVSSLIQVLVTRQRMQKAMGKRGPRSMLLGTFFGFISSSCSFSALSTTRAIFSKGAGLATSVAFLLASTNLVIELGMVIAVFLGWQFVVGEYVGGLLLILISWLLIKITRPRRMEAQARQRLSDNNDSDDSKQSDWKQQLTSMRSWQNIGQTYVMEWQMVWRDVLIGFTVAGIISAMVPQSFFQALFIGSGTENFANPGFTAVLTQTLVAPMAAFFTFIGSMGNIPLAAVLFGQGVCFAGVIAFIFSDLVVLPVLRIHARYYGWKMALYLLALMLVAIVVAALLLHYALALLGMLPNPSAVAAPGQRDYFVLNYQFYLNIVLLALNAVLIWLWRKSRTADKHDKQQDKSERSVTDIVLAILVVLALLWLSGGMLVALF
jgi:uncharacterized protein